MSQLHKKAYAYLVGQIDEALDIIGGGVSPADVTGNIHKLLLVHAKLQNALLMVEDLFLEEEDDEDEKNE